MTRFNLISVRGGEPAPDYVSVLRAAQARSGAWLKGQDARSRLDLVNADGAILLGWNDPEVEAAAADPAASGLPARVAARLAAMIPHAEAVAFESSLSHAVAGALVAARTVTGRDGAYFCDEAVSVAGSLEDLAALVDERGGELAAIVIRPLDAAPSFLKAVRRLADRAGAMLIFEEGRSALRVHRGGAQALSGVRADAVVLGPSLANGRSLCAVTGSVELLSVFERQGDQPDLSAFAAADVVLSRVARDDVAQALQVHGAEIVAELQMRLIATGAGQMVSLHGDPSWSVVAGDTAFETALCAALAEEGVMFQGAHILSAAIAGREIGTLLKAYDRVLAPLVDQCRWPRRRAG
jgi:glutamate-1-semialdehyde 2,1-aminomutase